MPLASAPGSEAFYRRSMRKGVGGDVEGEAMRANLSFQNSLRAETPPPRSASKRTLGASTPTDSEVDQLLTRLANGSPSLLRGAGITPPPARPAWVDPKPHTPRDGKRNLWHPIENLPKFPVPSPAVADAAATRSRASPAAAVVKSPQRTSTTTYGADGDDPSRAIRFGTPERPEGAPARVDDRLPVFERLYRAVPSGQRPKFLPPNPPNAGSSPGAAQGARANRALAEARREIASLRAELAAREVSEAAGDADAAPAVAAEMARRGVTLAALESEADADAAASDALEAVRRAGSVPSTPVGPNVRVVSDRPADSPVLRVAFDPDAVDWRFPVPEGATGPNPGENVGSARKPPWRERLRFAEERRAAKAAAWEEEIRSRAEADAATRRLVEEAEAELERLRARRSDVVARQMHRRARIAAKADPKGMPTRRAPWGFSGARGTAENIRAKRGSAVGGAAEKRGTTGGSAGVTRRANETSASSPKASSPARVSAASPANTSPANASPAKKSPASSPLLAASSRGYGAAENPADAAAAAARRVRERERDAERREREAAAAAAARAAADAPRARRAAEREAKAKAAKAAAARGGGLAAAFAAPTVAAAGKRADIAKQTRKSSASASATARVKPAASRRLSLDARARSDARAESSRDAESSRVSDLTSSRVDTLEVELAEMRRAVETQGARVFGELEVLRSQMERMFEMLSASSATGRAGSETGNASGVGSSVPASPPRAARPPAAVGVASPGPSPRRAPAPRRGPSPAASPRTAAASVPAENRSPGIPTTSVNPFLSG